MITVAIVFVIVLVVLVAIRRGLFSRLSGNAARGAAAPLFSRAADDAPPQASAWEKRLLADALDDHRRDRAKATLFAELRAISEPAAVAVPAAAAPVASSPAKSADPFA